MYQYKAAMARSRGLDATWSAVDLSAVDINTLFTGYGKVILTLTHVSIPNDLYLDMDAARSLIPPSLHTRTIQQWLTSLGNATLPTTNAPPSYAERLVYYTDAWAAGYDIEPVDRKSSYNADLPRGAKNDLLLSRADVNFQTLWQYCMISVNGFFHRVGGSPEGLYVLEGGRTGLIANDNQVGLLSFREVGKLEYVPIVQGMVYKTHPSQKYGDYVNIKLPAPVEGKTLLLVLGGYLHILDGTYQQTGLQSVRVNMGNYPLAERLFESFDHINLESLKLVPGANNPRHFAVEDIYSDETILAYLTLPQSFFLLVDTPYLFARKHFVEKTKLPGRYVAATPFEPYPLFSAIGSHYVYKTKHEWGRVVLSCDNARDVDYNFNQSAWRGYASLDDKPYSAKPWDFARAYLLEIGRYDQ